MSIFVNQSNWFLDVRPFFVPLWLCARYIGAASGFGGAACTRAVGEGPPLAPPACRRGISARLCLARDQRDGTSHQLRLGRISGLGFVSSPARGEVLVSVGFFQHRLQIMPGVARGDLYHILRRAFGDNLAAFHAAFGA